MATSEHDAEHTEAHQPEADQAPAGGEPETSAGSPSGSADQGGMTRAPGRRLLIGMIAAGVALVTVTIAVLKVVNPSLAVLPPVIREPAGRPVASASGPAEPTPDLAAVSLAPTASGAASPTRAPVSQPAGPPGAGTPVLLSYEAESAESAGVRVRRVASASGGKVAGSLDRSDDHVTFVVTVPAAGRYTVTFYYISGGAESRAAVITVNSGAPTSVSFASTGGWETVGSLALPIDLAAGGNQVRFASAGTPAPDLDRITVGP